MGPGSFRYLIITVALLASTEHLAQSKYVLGTFVGWPIGDFGSTSVEDGSFAQPGWGMLLENEARFKSWPRIFSLGLHLSYQQNGMDDSAMAQSFTSALNFRTEVSEAKYRPLIITFGPFFDIPITPRFDVGIKTGIGFALTNIDSFEVSVYPSPNETPVVYDIDFKTSPSFSYLLGLNGEFKITRVIGLTAFVDFSAARSKVDSFVGTVGRAQSHFDLSFMNTGVGVAVIFD